MGSGTSEVHPMINYILLQHSKHQFLSHKRHLVWMFSLLSSNKHQAAKA